MAYIKKKDKALAAIIEEIKKNNVIGTYDDHAAYVWSKWPICVKDVCVDNMLVVSYEDGEKVIGCNFYYEDDSITNVRVVNNLSQKYVEGILLDMTEGYKKAKK